MKDDEEFEMLLDEIPHATSHHHHHRHMHQQQHHVNGGGGVYDDEQLSHCNNNNNKFTCASPVSGFSLQSDGSSSSLFSNGHSLSDHGSPTPPPLEDVKYHGNSSNGGGGGMWLDSNVPDFSTRKKTNDQSLIDELSLCRKFFGKMYISNEQDCFNLKDLSAADQNGHLLRNCYGGGNDHLKDSVGFHSPVSRSGNGYDAEISTALLGLEQEFRIGNLLESQLFSGRPSDALFSHEELNCRNGSLSSQWQKTKEQTSNNYYQRVSPVSNLCTSLSRLSMTDALLCAQRNGMHWNEERGVLNLPHSSQLSHPKPSYLSVENLQQCGLSPSSGRNTAPSNVRTRNAGLGALTSSDDSFIIQGSGLNYMINKGLDHSRSHHNKGSLHEMGVGKRLERRSQLNAQSQIAGICGNARSSAKFYCPFSPPSKYNSLSEARGYIYLLAKDQHGCRFLQRMFDEGTLEDVQLIFYEIIDHVVELMMNPFGNYLMQKFLEVCNEEQKMQILLMLTEDPEELVRISLNTHGTRVVQKLIETLKTRQQILLVISALEPGFLALIKDLNGNHVVQRCLQCFTNEDNKFIFVAAAKYCVDIATHQHGCCVLQRCISHSSGEYRENLVAEISANGLLLAQDAYGNYVVQFILELKVPSATSSLISQFEGNYVHLSTQKFSSHVVEKCLLVFNDESRSRIIRELLSASHFEQLLQDPHANYVVQTALRVSEGSQHNSLVEAIESHKAMSRNSPYSKRIFSQKLLKK